MLAKMPVVLHFRDSITATPDHHIVNHSISTTPRLNDVALEFGIIRHLFRVGHPATIER